MARAKNKEVRFISSSVKVQSLAPCSSPWKVPPILSALPFAHLRLDYFVDSVQSAVACYARTVSQKLRPKLALAIPDPSSDPKTSTLKEERILISEVLVRTKVSSFDWSSANFCFSVSICSLDGSVLHFHFKDNWIIIYSYFILLSGFCDKFQNGITVDCCDLYAG
jgi:hypothetical protein